jgi:hypothetical protein
LCNRQGVAGRAPSAPHSCIRSPWIAPTLLSKTNDTPAENAAATSALMSISDRRDIFDADIQLMDGAAMIKGKVESIARGITDQDNKNGPELLARLIQHLHGSGWLNAFPCAFG